MKIDSGAAWFAHIVWLPLPLSVLVVLVAIGEDRTGK
jgi:hypothetical protein